MDDCQQNTTNDITPAQCGATIVHIYDRTKGISGNWPGKSGREVLNWKRQYHMQGLLDQNGKATIIYGITAKIRKRRASDLPHTQEEFSVL